MISVKVYILYHLKAFLPGLIQAENDAEIQAKMDVKIRAENNAEIQPISVKELCYVS